MQITNKKFVWTEKYSVKVKEIDEQHKQWFEICDELLSYQEEEIVDRTLALKLVMKLGDYASYHLGTEEEFFIETNYPHSVEHVRAHDEFRENVRRFIAQTRDESSDLKKIVGETANFAGSWLLDHILLMDQKYSAFFNDHNIK